MNGFGGYGGFGFRDSFLQEMRMQFGITQAVHRTRQRPRSEFHEHMLDYQMDRFLYFRPGYIDGKGEVPYWGTKVWWRTLARAMKHAWWAEVHRAMGTMDNVNTDNRSFAIIKGITS